jgi:hypothetical protein
MSLPIYFVIIFGVVSILTLLFNALINKARSLNITNTYQLNKLFTALSKLHQLEDNLVKPELPESYSGYLVGCFTVYEMEILRNKLIAQSDEVKQRFLNGEMTPSVFEEYIDELLTESSVLKVELPPVKQFVCVASYNEARISA